MVFSNDEACWITHGDRVIGFIRQGATYQINVWDNDGRSNFHLGADKGEVEALLAFLQSSPAK